MKYPTIIINVPKKPLKMGQEVKIKGPNNEILNAKIAGIEPFTPIANIVRVLLDGIDKDLDLTNYELLL